MAKKILVIQNPVSGTIQNKMNFDFVMNKLKKKRKYDLTIKSTTSTEGADGIIRKTSENYDFIFVCGGDGTLNQVITEVSTDTDKKKPIIYMPLGTTNDFARSLKTKKRKRKNKKNNVLELSREQCDTGRINNKYYFNYIAAMGLFTKTSYSTNRTAKRIFGRLAYITSGIREMFSIKEHKAKIYINNEIIEDKFIYIGISNSYSIGGFKIFNDDEIELNDGKFEVLLVKKPKNIFALIKLAVNVFTRKRNNNNIIFKQSPNIKISTKEKIIWTFDGEYAGNFDEIVINNLNKNVEFII